MKDLTRFGDQLPTGFHFLSRHGTKHAVDSRELEITPPSPRIAGQQIQHIQTHTNAHMPGVKSREFGGVWRVTAATGALGVLSILCSSEEECGLISSKLS